MSLYSKAMKSTCWIALIATLYCFVGSEASKEDDCVEVGYARSSGSLPYDTLETVKERLLARWATEDETNFPPYTQLPVPLKNITRAAYLLEEVSKEVVSKIRKTRVGKRCNGDWLLRGLERHVRPVVNMDKELAAHLGLALSFRCMVGSPYPNVDGTCVSEESPDMGAIGAKFLRLLPSRPDHDGFSLRKSVSESVGELPSARSVASLIRKHLKAPAVTNLFTHWAHFLQRDIFSIPTSPYTEGVNCCKAPNTEDCAPIFVPEDDPLHSSQKCINYRRSARAQAILGHRESFSLVSTYIDATPLYGPTNEVAFQRKTGYFGYLKGPEKFEGEKSNKCKILESFEGCFLQDESFKVYPGIRALLLLEHNRLADTLADLNPHFDDSLLYNEARRIMIAEYASITYGEYLPLLLGEDIVKKHFLKPGMKAPEAAYIKDVNPGVLSSFAVAAFRNPSMVTEWDKKSQEGHEELFDSAQYDSVASDNYQDLLAMDVQRGRDHGLPGYVTWRRFCEPGLVLDTWEDLEKVLPEQAVSSLKNLYKGELDDLDVMVALLEPPIEGAVVGKTFSCIMADQFARLRTGNRLYWEHDANLLTTQQKEVLVQSRLATVLCQNLPVTEVPSNPFKPTSDSNPLIKCSELAPLNITLWTDTSLIESMKELKKRRGQPVANPEQVMEQIEEEEEILADEDVASSTAGKTRSLSEESSVSSAKASTNENLDPASPTQLHQQAASAELPSKRLTTATVREEL